MSAVAPVMRFAARFAARSRLSLDPVVIGLTAALLLLGLVMVTSASVTLAARDGDPFFFLERQLLFSLVGVGCACIAIRPRRKLSIASTIWNWLRGFRSSCGVQCPTISC